MDVLLDTHTFLWFVWADSKLSAFARQVIEDTDNRKLFSMASIWELAIKVSIGKLDLDLPLNDFLSETLDNNGFTVLDIKRIHVIAIENMEPHHRDPFDRILIAQSLVESIPIVSADSQFDAYGVSRLW